ncbi:unnamed protein product, partial [Brenthis ino]
MESLFIVLTLASWATAARLENVYLPPNSGASSGVDVGLKTPFVDSASSASSQADILRYENEIDSDGWHYAYETSDGTKAEQNGRVLPGAAPEEGSLQVSGSYSYISDDGQTYSISYTADENGYHPVGDHLPTPPPIPEAILKSLQLTAGGDGQYSKQKSSYDADAGY